ncbi:MAG: hypothetical protein ACF8NJ_10425 [Phycisphaerales bacterium JB038]
MARAPLDVLLQEPSEKRFPPPLSTFEWACHLACLAMFVWGILDILLNLSAFRAVQQSAQPVPKAAESGLWILYGSAVGTYLLLLALTPFPKLYNYPFKLKPGEERVVFPPTRSAVNFIAVQTVLMLLLINWDMIRVVVQGRGSVIGWVVGVLLSVMSATIAYLMLKLLRLHASYEPPAEDAGSESA